MPYLFAPNDPAGKCKAVMKEMKYDGRYYRSCDVYYNDCGKTYNVNDSGFYYYCTYYPDYERIQFDHYSDCPTLGEDTWCAGGSCEAHVYYGGTYKIVTVPCYYQDCG